MRQAREDRLQQDNLMAQGMQQEAQQREEQRLASEHVLGALSEEECLRKSCRSGLGMELFFSRFGQSIRIFLHQPIFSREACSM